MKHPGEGPRVVQPEGWPRPRGYANGLLVPAGHDLLFLAGQIGWDATERLVDGGFVAQFEQALRNVAELVEAAGGSVEHIVRLTMYCVDKRQYLADLEGVGRAYRAVLGRHFPVMAMVEVAALVEDGALIEIEATAALPPRGQEEG